MAILTGTLTHDDLNGTRQADQMLALSGDDRVVGGGGADLIDGGDGNDTLYAAQSGQWRDGALDSVFGGWGDDAIHGAYGDILEGGFGFDRLSLDVKDATQGVELDFRPMTLGINVGLGGLAQISIPLGTGRLAGFEAVDRLIGSDHDDIFRLSNGDASDSVVNAGDGDDYVRSGKGDDRLVGEAGRDVLIGGAGADIIDGGADGDRLIGGRGEDVLTGGSGADLFVFRPGETARGRLRADTITDFSQADQDRIVLAPIDAVAGTDQNERLRFIGDAGFSGTAGEVRFSQVDGATFVSADMDGDARADLSIRLEGTIDLVARDFVL